MGVDDLAPDLRRYGVDVIGCDEGRSRGALGGGNLGEDHLHRAADQATGPVRFLSPLLSEGEPEVAPPRHGIDPVVGFAIEMVEPKFHAPDDSVAGSVRSGHTPWAPDVRSRRVGTLPGRT